MQGSSVLTAAMSTRKPAPRLAVPKQRYFKGKAPKGANAVDSGSEDDEGQAAPEDNTEDCNDAQRT